MIRSTFRMFAVIALLCAATTAHAQSSPSSDDIAKAQERIARFEQMRLASLKASLESPDVEFKILQPKLLRVIILQFQQSIGATGFSRRGRNFTNPMITALGPTAVQKARMELQDALDKTDVTTGEIVEKLKTLRSAREAARVELEAAQADLRDFVTIRQEAILVEMGLLD